MNGTAPQEMSEAAPEALMFAEAYASLGWRTFPAHSVHDGRCTCGRVDCDRPGKHPWARHGLKDATVDLERADVDLAAGRMTVTGLAVADPNALDTDLFRASTIEADVSATNLLRKRLKIDRIVMSDA